MLPTDGFCSPLAGTYHSSHLTLPCRKVLAKARELGFTVIHTREGHRPDLTDLFPNKKFRSKAIGAWPGARMHAIHGCARETFSIDRRTSVVSSDACKR